MIYFLLVFVVIALVLAGLALKSFRYRDFAPRERGMKLYLVLWFVIFGLIVGGTVYYWKSPEFSKKTKAEWETIFTASGVGSQKTELFELPVLKRRKLVLHSNCTGVDSVSVHLIRSDGLDEAGGFPILRVYESGIDSVAFRRRKGEYYLDMRTETCSWEAYIKIR